MTEAFDPQALLAQALEMQQRLMDAQAEAASETVEGSAGGGAVRVTMTGTGEVTAVRIDPAVVVPDDVDMLEDLIVAAFHDAATRVAELAQDQMGLGALGDLFGGGEGGLGSLAGLFGGGVIEAGEADPAARVEPPLTELPPGERS